MQERIHGKIIDRLAAKVQDRNLPPRSDMHIVDMREIDAMKCNVLIGYEGHVGSEPNLSQVERFVEATFNGKLHAQSTTAQLHEADNAVSVCLTMHTDTRPVVDATVMRRVAGNGYFDTSTGHVWRVCDDGTKKFLVRQSDDNIADIVASKIIRNTRTDANFAKVRQAAPMLVKGDRVRFFDGTLPMNGEVKSLGPDTATISANGKSYTVSRDAVFNVVSRSESFVSTDKKDLNDYFARAFGNKEFADQMTNKMSRDSDDGDPGFEGTVGGEKK